MRRDLFVFAGQSNMMGASVYPPKRKIDVKNSYEYKHKARRLGANSGDFVVANYPVGEFSYIDIEKAYALDMVNEKGNSTLVDYVNNTYFCPAMFNLRSEKDKTIYSFSEFSEATAQYGATLAPLLAEEWEELGGSCAYAHIAKGGVPIAYYFCDRMAKEYNRRITKYNKVYGTSYNTEVAVQMRGASEYCFEKCKDFFADAEKYFLDDDLRAKCFFWLQGESDTSDAPMEYQIKLEIFWEELKKIGFTHFFCIRVDYFGSDGIANVMKAQEDFVSKHDDAYMLTRAASYFTHPMQDGREWFVAPPQEIYRNCRDSFYGYNNHHINEKGFSLLAKRVAKNAYRILIARKSPKLERENVRTLYSGKENVNV